MAKNHTIRELLISLGISEYDSIVPYFPKVRDRDDISVLKCTKSGVILLSSSDHVSIAHYTEKVFNGRGAQDRETAILKTRADTERRMHQFKKVITDKKWIDIGTGAGGIIDACAPFTRDVVAVEPQSLSREALIDLGYRAYPLVEDVPDQDFDVATLFHVFEHFTNPLETLRAIKAKLKKGGKIIVEVPHAEDALISLFNNESFKAHTFWSEHLLLHTKESLRIFLEAAGFSDILVRGFQRYPLANHLYWLSQGKPGGQDTWPFMQSKELDGAYADVLENLNKTDTIIAIAQNQ